MEQVFKFNRSNASLLQGGSLLVILSGPSGVGKDTILDHIRRLNRPFHYALTVTTRPKRPDENDGVDYIFTDSQHFHQMRKRGELLEYAQVYDHWYGVPRYQVRDALEKGLDVIVKVDVQGATTIKKNVPDGVFVFLMPPSEEALVRRLRQRGSESQEQLNLRLKMALEEMNCLPVFDYVVVNHDGCIDETVATLDFIITAEKCRVPPRRVRII